MSERATDGAAGSASPDLSRGKSARLADELRRAHDGDAWHGSAIGELLADVTAVEASARPISGAHTIWELTVHATAWVREVTRRLRTGVAGMPADGDWPSTPARATEVEWEAARAALRDAHGELSAEVEAFPAARFSALVGDARDAPLGTGVSYEGMLHGLSQHDAYHGGQIALLKRAQRST